MKAFYIVALLSCLVLAVACQEDAADQFEIKGRVLLNFRGNATHPEGSPAVSTPQQQKEALRQMRVVLKGPTSLIRTTMVRQDGSFLLCAHNFVHSNVFYIGFAI